MLRVVDDHAPDLLPAVDRARGRVQAEGLQLGGTVAEEPTDHAAAARPIYGIRVGAGTPPPAAAYGRVRDAERAADERDGRDGRVGDDVGDGGERVHGEHVLAAGVAVRLAAVHGRGRERDAAAAVEEVDAGQQEGERVQRDDGCAPGAGLGRGGGGGGSAEADGDECGGRCGGYGEGRRGAGPAVLTFTLPTATGAFAALTTATARDTRALTTPAGALAPATSVSTFPLQPACRHAVNTTLSIPNTISRHAASTVTSSTTSTVVAAETPDGLGRTETTARRTGSEEEKPTCHHDRPRGEHWPRAREHRTGWRARVRGSSRRRSSCSGGTDG